MDVRLPDLGEDAGTSAKVTFWYFEVGDRVEEGSDLVEMMTDKATFNVPSPKSGFLAEIVADEGEIVSVGEVLAIIEEE
jgi:pyruvate/2-oxoglutarate dehydrogenase complex dihydrolipoamide acyltransferase (E2) component